jgi:hypothetical protein
VPPRDVIAERDEWTDRMQRFRLIAGATANHLARKHGLVPGMAEYAGEESGVALADGVTTEAGA